MSFCPKNHRGYEGLINIFQHQKDWQKVITSSQQFIKKFPKKFQGYWWLGQAYKNLAEYDNAITQFELLQAKLPFEHRGYQGVIDIANHQNDWQALLKASEAYIDKLPEKIEGHYHKGMALKNLKRFDEAEQFFIELARQFPNHIQPLTGLASVYYTLRKFKESIETLELAESRFPLNASIIKQLMDYYLRYNEPDKALIMFDKHIEDKSSAKNQLLLAKIYQIKHSNADYVDRLDKLYQQYPDDIDVGIAYANALINFTMEDE